MNSALFCKTAKALLKEKSISANKMLADLSINRNLFGDIEKRGSVPSVDHVSAIADYLGVTERYLLRGIDDTSQLNSDEAKLINRYRSLDEDGQDVVRVSALNELRRMEQIKSLGVSVNPNPPSATPGRDEAMVRPGTSPPGRVKHPQTKPKKAQ